MGNGFVEPSRTQPVPLDIGDSRKTYLGALWAPDGTSNLRKPETIALAFLTAFLLEGWPLMPIPVYCNHIFLPKVVKSLPI